MTILRDLSAGRREDEESKQTRSHQKTNRLHMLRQLLEARGMDHTALGKELGYNAASTIHKWLADGEMPVVASLAVEALLRRLGTEGRPVAFAAVTIRRDASETFLKVCESLGVVVSLNQFPEGSSPKGLGILVLRIPVAHGEALRAVARSFGGEYLTLDV